MFLSPKIWGCKYTNNFLFINKKAVFQHFGLLITSAASDLLLLFLFLLFSFPLSLYSYTFSPLPLPPSSFISLSSYPFLHIPFSIPFPSYPFLHLLSFSYILSLSRFRSLPILLLRHIPLIPVPRSYGSSPSDRHHTDRHYPERHHPERHHPDRQAEFQGQSCLSVPKTGAQDAKTEETGRVWADLAPVGARNKGRRHKNGRDRQSFGVKVA